MIFKSELMTPVDARTQSLKDSYVGPHHYFPTSASFCHILGLMSLVISKPSRASPHCRTCGKPMKGHPRTTCGMLNASTAQTNLSTAELQSVSCASNLGDILPVTVPAYFTLNTRDTETIHALKGESSPTPFLERSRPTAGSSSFRQRQQSSERVPPAIEDLLAFLLGLHHPVDPARVRFALSLLDEIEGVADVKDEMKGVADVKDAMKGVANVKDEMEGVSGVKDEVEQVADIKDESCAMDAVGEIVNQSSKRQNRSLHRCAGKGSVASASKLRVALTYLMMMIVTFVLTATLFGRS
ncbi:hypothetical protein BKA70DRAFT_1231680 [Coprinopsis sp. MPI-PUGE-AT-0042]|nr:hypothetical protein BKA70DRAFT_1231680 [Coprinopsis sp. MPI-PUGE-AT-0042]